VAARSRGFRSGGHLGRSAPPVPIGLAAATLPVRSDPAGSAHRSGEASARTTDREDRRHVDVPRGSVTLQELRHASPPRSGERPGRVAGTAVEREEAPDASGSTQAAPLHGDRSRWPRLSGTRPEGRPRGVPRADTGGRDAFCRRAREATGHQKVRPAGRSQGRRRPGPFGGLAQASTSA
jgi:hypothetical protein